MPRWMIYGANGYTGRLIAEQATRLGLSPVLGGRRQGAIQALAAQFNCESRVFDVADPVAAKQALSGIQLVLNCAGPFSATSRPMIAACLGAGAHYLDITGEIDVFEYARSQDAAARAKSVVILPGVGFDVIPTDCVASALKEAMPDADQLALGFQSRSRMSPGTAKTSIEGMAQGGKVRKDGLIITVPFAYKVREIDFGRGPACATTIPWGDIATAFSSTAIPNIEVFMATPHAMVRKMKRLNLIRPFLGIGFVQRLLKATIERRVSGPNQSARERDTTAVWGEVCNAGGERKVARIEVANGYQLTIDGSLHVVRQLLDHPPERGGYFTPSSLFGWRLIEALPGSTPMKISPA